MLAMPIVFAFKSQSVALGATSYEAAPPKEGARGTPIGLFAVDSGALASPNGR